MTASPLFSIKSIFDEAKLCLMNSFFSNKKVLSLLYYMLDDLSEANLSGFQNSLEELYNYAPGDFQRLVRILNEVFAGRGICFELAVMPGTGASAQSVHCLSITSSHMKRALLLPLVLGKQIAVGVCKLSKVFLGGNFWMEPIYNESPALAFRRIVSLLSSETVVSPPPMSARPVVAPALAYPAPAPAYPVPAQAPAAAYTAPSYPAQAPAAAYTAPSYPTPAPEYSAPRQTYTRLAKLTFQAA